MSMCLEEILAGKKIVGIKVKTPTVWLKVNGGGWIEITAEGDCCSDAFIDATLLEGSPTLTGKTVEIGFPAETSTQAEDEITAVLFEGDRGSVSILHRNSSNGFYGNHLSVNERGEPPPDALDGTCYCRHVDFAKYSSEVGR